MHEVQTDATLTIRLGKDLLERFRIVAVKEHRPMSEIVREFLAWYVEENR